MASSSGLPAADYVEIQNLYAYEPLAKSRQPGWLLVKRRPWRSALPMQGSS